MRNKNLIGMLGRQMTGKDLSTSIVQFLVDNHINDFGNRGIDLFEDYLKDDNIAKAAYKNVKFGDALKDITCIILGCSRADLEDREFKSKELGSEWDYYVADTMNIFSSVVKSSVKKSLTPRFAMQYIGTDLFRRRFNDNTWVNVLFNKYIPHKNIPCSDGILRPYPGDVDREIKYPRWCVSDCRFQNEVDAIKERGGIIIKLERNTGIIDEHESELAIDKITNYDYLVDNNSSIEDLITSIREILIKEQII